MPTVSSATAERMTIRGLDAAGGCCQCPCLAGAASVRKARQRRVVVRQRWHSSALSVAKKLSATALSQQLAFLLRLPTKPALAPYHRGTRRRRVRPTS